MADDQFVLVPYGGYNPNVQTINMIGISGNNGTSKICCSIEDSSFQVAPVYYCRLTSNPYGMYISSFNTEHTEYRMSVCTSTNSASQRTNIIDILYIDSARVRYWPANNYQWIVDTDVTPFATTQEAAEAFMNMFPDDYVNIQYVGNGCSIAGPSYTMQGTGVVVPVTLPIGASLTADSISVTKGGSHIDFNYNPQTQQIAFTAI